MFQKATRAAKKWKILFRGPSGSGKTHSALLIAKGLAQGGKIAVVDTEKLSSTHLAGKVDFDVLDFNKEFKGNHDYKNYIKIIEEAANNGYKVLVIDSFSHAWMGEGGILQLVDSLASTKFKGNSYAAWKVGNDVYNQLINKILFNTDMHILLTGRTKTEYVQDYDETGRKQIRKVGMKLEQRDGLDYEFDVVLDFSNNKPGYGLPEKDRTGIFSETGEMITEDTSEKLINYNKGLREEEPIKEVEEVKEKVKEEVVKPKKVRKSSMNDQLNEDVRQEKEVKENVGMNFDDVFVKVKEYAEHYDLVTDERKKKIFVKMMLSVGMSKEAMRELVSSSFSDKLEKMMDIKTLRELQLKIEQDYIWGQENVKVVEESGLLNA